MAQRNTIYQDLTTQLILVSRINLLLSVVFSWDLLKFGFVNLFTEWINYNHGSGSLRIYLDAVVLSVKS